MLTDSKSYIALSTKRNDTLTHSLCESTWIYITYRFTIKQDVIWDTEICIVVCCGILSHILVYDNAHNHTRTYTHISVLRYVEQFLVKDNAHTHTHTYIHTHRVCCGILGHILGYDNAHNHTYTHISVLRYIESFFVYDNAHTHTYIYTY
jgi:hypothetical protein